MVEIVLVVVVDLACESQLLHHKTGKMLINFEVAVAIVHSPLWI